jgi:DNA-binding NarL/FixJ family response regulator
MSAIRILVADDHRDFRKVVSDYLRGLPNVVVVGEADDGIDVIDKMEKFNPDVVLMDITMPRRNGLDATRIIKNRWPSVKVVIATMHDSKMYRSQALDAAADGFIVKSSLRSGLKEIFGNGVFSPVFAVAESVAGK